MTLGHQHTRNPASCYTRSLSDMIDTNAITVHTVQLSSAQLDVIVEALSGYAEACRVNGATPELNKLIDALDVRINSDFAEA